MSAQANNPTRISRIDIPPVLTENGDPDPNFEAHSVVATYGGSTNMNPELVTWEDVKGQITPAIEEMGKETIKVIADVRQKIRDGTESTPANYREIIAQMGLDRVESGLVGYVIFEPNLIVLIYEDELGAHDVPRAVPYHTAGKSQVTMLFYASKVATAEHEKESDPEERRILSAATSKLARIGYPRAGLDESDASVRGLFRLEKDLQVNLSGASNVALTGRGYYAAVELRLFRNARIIACASSRGAEKSDAPGDHQLPPPFTEDADRYEALVVGRFSDMLVTLDALKAFADSGRECYRQAFIIGVPLYIETIKHNLNDDIQC